MGVCINLIFNKIMSLNYKEILGKYPTTRENLVTAMQDIQEAEGYISAEAVAVAAVTAAVTTAITTAISAVATIMGSAITVTAVVGASRARLRCPLPFAFVRPGREVRRASPVLRVLRE